MTVLKSSADARGQEAVIEAIVTAVAEADGVRPTDLQPPLASVIDPDALEKLVDSMSSWPDQPDGSVEFVYSGYEITVSEDRDVSIAELDAQG